MNATITLADHPRSTRPRKHWRYLNLLNAIFALHDDLSHDPDKVTFRRDDGVTFFVNLSVNYVSFGKEGEPEENRSWTENISDGQIRDLLVLFIDRNDDDLRSFGWNLSPRSTRPR